MLRNEPLFTRLMATIAAVVAFMAWAMLWPGTAHADPQPTRCGMHASGKKADGKMWTGAAPRMFVGTDGYWHICQPWVPDGGDPNMPEPASTATCPAGDVVERWTQDQRECLGDKLLPETAAGRAVVLIDANGGTRGMAAFRCAPNPHIVTGAVWQLEGSYCNWLYPPADPTDTQRRHKLGDAKIGVVPKAK